MTHAHVSPSHVTLNWDSVRSHVEARSFPFMAIGSTGGFGRTRLHLVSAVACDRRTEATEHFCHLVNESIDEVLENNPGMSIATATMVVVVAVKEFLEDPST